MDQNLHESISTLYKSHPHPQEYFLTSHAKHVLTRFGFCSKSLFSLHFGLVNWWQQRLTGHQTFWSDDHLVPGNTRFVDLSLSVGAWGTPIGECQQDQAFFCISHIWVSIHAQSSHLNNPVSNPTWYEAGWIIPPGISTGWLVGYWTLGLRRLSPLTLPALQCWAMPIGPNIFAPAIHVSPIKWPFATFWLSRKLDTYQWFTSSRAGHLVLCWWGVVDLPLILRNRVSSWCNG